MSTAVKVLTIGPNGGTTVYSSIRATARALSGDGTDGIRTTIADRVWQGGGYVGDVWVQPTRHPGGVRRPSLVSRW